MAGEERRKALGLPEPRIVPHSLESEQALLGAVLMNNDVFKRVSQIVREDHFYEDVHKAVWHVAAGLIEKGQVANPITIRPYIGEKDLGGGMTAGQYAARLAAQATTVANAPDYARTVRDLALRRRLITDAEAIREVAYDCPVEMTAEQIFADLEKRLEEARPLMNGGPDSDFVDFGRIGSDDVYDAYRRKAGLVGISTGLPRLDDALGGLQKTDLIILAGRPGMGKSALAGNVALNVARHLQDRIVDGYKTGVVAFSSLEMGQSQIKQRLLSDLSSVPFWKLKRGIASEEEMTRYVEAEQAFRTLPLAIDASAGLSISQLKMRLRGLKKRRGLELVVVDYLQLLTGSGRKDRRNEEVTEITVGLKEMAKELDVPVLALSQLSRQVEYREDKRPQLSDLRESGSIEQDADVVLFVYREEYYLKKAEPKPNSEAHFDWERSMRRARGVGEVIIGKNRHGPENTVVLGFEGEFTRFTNEPAEREPEPASAPEREREEKTPRSKVVGPVLQALHVLHALQGVHGMPSTDDMLNVPPGLRVVPYLAWKDACVAELLDPTRTEKEKAKFMEDAYRALREEGFVRRGGTMSESFVWLTDKGARL